jgi:poly(U)-specific endoribonuclease
LSWRGNPGDKTPDVVTLSYKWRAFDYKAKKFRTLTKPIGGFWVGPSAEGLMAIGTVRFLNDVFAPKKAEINNVRYNLSMFRSPNGRNLRTFFPEFVEML